MPSRSKLSGAAQRKKARIRDGDPPGNPARIQRMIDVLTQLKMKKGVYYDKWKKNQMAGAKAARKRRQASCVPK